MASNPDSSRKAIAYLIRGTPRITLDSLDDGADSSAWSSTLDLQKGWYLHNVLLRIWPWNTDTRPVWSRVHSYPATFTTRVRWFSWKVYGQERLHEFQGFLAACLKTSFRQRDYVPILRLEGPNSATRFRASLFHEFHERLVRMVAISWTRGWP